MNTLEFISTLIKSLAWPIVVLTIVIILKDPVRKIISNLNTLTFNNLEMSFEQKLDQLESTLEEKDPTDEQTQTEISIDKDFLTVAQISPGAAITMAWTKIEQEIHTFIIRHNLSDKPNLTPLKNIQILQSSGLVNMETNASLNELKNITKPSSTSSCT
ncbi:hypothetical protein [Cytobacillus firmus]|uniref:hypothetical protein n=1 Tax=Cytobacillus firmus TaxID=1399 RepID=UPI001C97160B|nr:hypothetical protein [Cytobacillus firmus]MBY6053312.1 hypothetical protein [Cytobacillus firmus]